MANVCEPKIISEANRSVFGFPAKCSQGMQEFQSDISIVITARQEISLARASGQKNQNIKDLETKLRNVVKSVQDKYQKLSESCHSGDRVSCGYVYHYDRFARNFGSLEVFETGKRKPEPVPMRAMKSGTVLLPLSSHPNQEILLDTGAQATGISTEWQQHHPEYFHSATVHYYNQAKQVMISGLIFAVGNLSFSPTIAVITPALDMLEGSNHHQATIAILGLDFLSLIPWEINYDHSTVTFYVDVNNRLKDKKEHWFPIPIHLQSKAMGYDMSVTANINDVPFNLVIDTGTNITDMLEQCVQRIPNLPVGKGDTGIHVGGLEATWNAENVTARVAGVTQTIPLLSVTPASSRQNLRLGNSGVCGLLGLDFLARYNLLWDPESFLLYASPSRQRAKIRDNGSIGFTPLRDKQSGQMIVDGLVDGGPAQKAGLQVGDVITHIENKPASTITIMQTLDLRYSENPAIPLSVVRNGKEMKLILKRDIKTP